MAESSEVVVVGGGAAGCAVAYYLSQSGVRVTIVEREGIGSQASGYSAGGLNPLQGEGAPGLMGPVYMESFRMHMELRDRLKDESGVDLLPQSISMVRVAFDDSELAEMRETLEIFQAADGFSAAWLDTDEVYGLEPRLAPGIIRALRTEGNKALNSHAYTVALSKAAERHGATLRTGVVTGLRTHAGRATAVVLGDGELACDHVVLATGPWVKEAERWLDIPIPVEPLKGEILRMELTEGLPPDHDFACGSVNLFHRADGLIWIGTTEERKGFDLRPSESVRQTLLQGATRVMPALADARLVKHTACLRPVTADWLPIIGRSPGWENVYLATGAGKKGILISTGMGRAVTDLITRGSTDLEIAPFTPDRFATAS